VRIDCGGAHCNFEDEYKCRYKFFYNCEIYNKKLEIGGRRGSGPAFRCQECLDAEQSEE